MPALKNIKHETFAQAYAVSGNAAAAWVKATKGKKTHSDANGAKWAVISSIKARVAELRAKADALSEASTVLTILEKRQFLARVVRTPVGEIDHSSDLCQERTYIEGQEETSVKIKMPDKLRAVQLDNDLAVDGAEAGANKAMEIIIRKL